MGLLLEAKSPVDQTKVFIFACEGPDAYVDLPTTDERKRLQAEMATYGRNTLPQAKATRHSEIKLAATAKAHLTPRQPQPPLPRALVQAVADSSLELCAAAETVQPVRIVPSKNVTMKIGRVLADLTCQKPEPKRVNGCGGGCHRDVQAKANSGEELCVLWFASEHRASPFVEWREVRASKCLTTYFRHYWQEMIDSELVSYENVANYFADTKKYAGFHRDNWERLIRQNMNGMVGKPRLRWQFRVPVSDLQRLDEPDMKPLMIFARDGTSDAPNDWWSKDTIGYYGEQAQLSKATALTNQKRMFNV